MGDPSIMLEWGKLLSSARRKDLSDRADPVPLNAAGTRTEIERDYDRILFSTPVRRLADKTQVFPLDKNDSVRNRLTHSHEVSNLARSIGVALVYDDKSKFPKDDQAKRDLPSMLAAIGLAHDLGNPPFGHQGEKAISSWFKDNAATALDLEGTEGVSALEIQRMKLDYLNFEGNAQTFRILTKLQILNDEFGLNVCCGTLAALMKYPVTSELISDDNKATKKFGCFHSELVCLDEVFRETGLIKGVRHPLAYIMEACDDIAYSVLDAEDAVKKGLVSFSDIISYLIATYPEDRMIREIVEKAEKRHIVHRGHNLSPAELNDISTQMFRVFAIGAMISAVIVALEENYDSIMNGKFNGDLIGSSAAKLACKGLKDFSFKHAFIHRSVLAIELQGYNVIHSLMDMMWGAIAARGDPLVVDARDSEANVFQRYVYNRISENYRRIFESKNNHLPLNYKRSQLLADMISGMTDSYAVSLEQELKGLCSTNG
ncbi:dGTP triphosphohydrolase [Sphingomonas sp. VDB2]|uniref:dGTP triphosphohydrolase n=1 Tax=Sphingomonas sp. VDB2 TaxID=3228751 RepID=UPI003A7FCB4E